MTHFSFYSANRKYKGNKGHLWAFSSYFYTNDNSLPGRIPGYATRTQFPLNRHFFEERKTLDSCGTRTSCMPGKKHCQQYSKESHSRKEIRMSHRNMLCCTSIASEFFKLNCHTENKLVITGPKFLPFTLNKCRLVTQVIKQTEYSVHTSAENERNIPL